MKVALLGLPQAGKKTLFSLLTGRDVAESRRPDEAVEGIAHIRDPRVDALTAICKPKKTTYAENNFVLCPDVTEGSGARPWLEKARRCDLLCLIVRAFESEAVYHPTGSVDAGRDLANIRAELFLADMATIDTRLTRLEKEKRAGQTTAQAVEQEALGKCQAALENDQPVSSIELTPPERAAIKSLDLVTAIPVLVVHNVSEEALGADMPDGVLAVSCQIEQEISALEDDAERIDYLESLGLEAPGVDRVNAAAYGALGLMSYYTVGEDEVRAWTIRKGSTAPVAGGKIHSDIERGFIRVEVMRYDDFVAAGSEKAAKEQGMMQLKGKDYVMEDGDICHFLFNV